VNLIKEGEINVIKLIAIVPIEIIFVSTDFAGNSLSGKVEDDRKHWEDFVLKCKLNDQYAVEVLLDNWQDRGEHDEDVIEYIIEHPECMRVVTAYDKTEPLMSEDDYEETPILSSKD